MKNKTLLVINSTPIMQKGRNLKIPLTGLLNLYLQVSVSIIYARGTLESRPRNPRLRGT
jgi:hypothetical protein